jgi:hypothetical protein
VFQVNKRYSVSKNNGAWQKIPICESSTGFPTKANKSPEQVNHRHTHVGNEVALIKLLWINGTIVSPKTGPDFLSRHWLQRKQSQCLQGQIGIKKKTPLVKNGVFS